MPKPLRLPGASEQAVLQGLKLRLIEPEEKSRWDQLITEQHYLKNSNLVGEQLRYVAEYEGQWMGLLGWSAPALHLKAREAWVRWSPEQLRQRRHFLAQNSRFLLLCERLQLPNLATRSLGLCCQRLSQDWLQTYGHPIVAVESFVDAQLFRGTAYKAGGWRLLGATAGFGRCVEDYYQRHDRPKQLWVRALDRVGLLALKAPKLPPSLERYEQKPAPRCHLHAQERLNLLDRLPQVRDPRGRKGRWHPWPAILGILCLAKLAGVAGAQKDIAAFAQRLTQAQRRQLGCRRHPQKAKERVVPGPSTFFRALKAVDYLALEKTLKEWQKDVLGAPHPKELIVLDGKVVHAAGKQTVVNAISVPSGWVHGVELVHQKSDQPSPEDQPVAHARTGAENEIPAARRLLSRMDLVGKLVSLDAMHTQHQTAGQVVLEAGGDYLLTLKDNQPTLLKTAQTLVPDVFFPSGTLRPTTADGPDRGNEPGTTGNPPTGHSGD